MKNFSNYTDYDKKDNLHFESKARYSEFLQYNLN